MEPHLKWSRIILAWIFMGQCCSKLLHSCTVIARQQPAVAGRQKSEISARQEARVQLTPPMSGVSLKLFSDGATREIK